MIIQTLKDSAIQLSDSIANSLQESTSQMSDIGISIFLLPTIILVVYSFCKYTIGVDSSDIDFYDLGAELAIDLLSIFSSFLIGAYIVESRSSVDIISAIKIIGIFLIGSLILCYNRRKMIKIRSVHDAKMGSVNKRLIFNYFVDLICFGLVFVFI